MRKFLTDFEGKAYKMDNKKIEAFKKMVAKALAISKDELRRRKNGMPGESTVEQLEKVIIPELEKFSKMDYSNLPPADKRYLFSFGYAFRVWEWSMLNPSRLYLLLLILNDKYKEL